jgi:RNA polymerase sigma-70 factor (ECF subfamily)
VQSGEELALERPAAQERAPGGAAGLEGIFKEHYPRLVGMLTRLTGARSEAEDIAANVFCKLARRPSLLDGHADQVAWVYRIASNAGIDALRRTFRRRRNEEAAAAETLRGPKEYCALDDLLNQERRAKVRSVLSELKPRDAQLLLLRTGGLGYKELAETIGVAPGSIGTMLARAEAAFERKYRARYGGAL